MLRSIITASLLIFLIPGCAKADSRMVPITEYAKLAHESSARTSATAMNSTTGNVSLPRFPSISPDGENIVFSWRGDLWKVGVSGGTAIRLTSHPADESRSAWSSDGKRIAFASDRSGYTNIYIMEADGSDIRLVTDTDRGCSLSSFGLDDVGNEVIALSSSREGDLFRSPRPYMVNSSGGSINRLHGAFGSEPAIHPDGKVIAFTRGGVRATRRHYKGSASRDLWTFNRDDNTFRRLTKYAGNDTSAKWAGDGKLLFLSDREQDCVNLYAMDPNAGESSATRLTDFKQHDIQHFDVSADGRTAVLHVWGSLYAFTLNEPNAKATPISINAGEDEQDRFELLSVDDKSSEAALSPDGKTMAYIAYGEVYVRNIEEKSTTQRVTTTHARENGIAWSPNGLKIYFSSDSDGTDSIYEATVALTRGEVKEEFEKTINPPEEKPEEDPNKDDNAPGDESDSGDDESASDEEDGAAEDNDTSDKSTKDDDSEEIDKKKKKKDEELPKELQADRWHDAIRFNIAPVVQTKNNDREPSPSPDGKSLAFRRGRGDLVILDLESSESRILAPGWDTGLEWRWSPDSRHIAYAQADLDFNSDIWVVPADASDKAVNVTKHPDDDGSPRWSADGRILAFTSQRVNDESDVWMVYLDAELEAYTPKELTKYYKDAADAAKKRKPLEIENPNKDDDEDIENGEDEKSDSGDVESVEKNGDDEEKGDKDEDDEKEAKPVKLALEDAYLRLRRITMLSGNEFDLELTPSGDRYVFSATIGERGLYSIQWDGKERKRLGGTLSVQHVSLTGDKVVVISKGQAGTVPPAGDKLEMVNITDKMLIDLEKQSSQKFLEAARILGEMFYHPTMKGLDWAALTTEYHTLAKQARTASEFNDVANRFLGELNGSHLGIFARGDSSDLQQPQGRLGTVHKRVPDGFEVVEVIEHSPAQTGPMALAVGDVITSIDSAPFAPTDTIESRLTGRIDEEVLLTIRRQLGEGDTQSLNMFITPISWGAQRQLKYSALRRRRAELVSEWTNGRIGYIHIQAMGQEALDVFERDLFAAAEGKDGLIIDVRDNGGGWTTDRLLSSIMVRPHAYTIPRGADPSKVGHYPHGRLFIQRYSLPINMMCNENSYSNAEIISHAFKTLERGTLVGTETFGAVISTGGTALIDGTFVRLPFRGWFLMDGTDMEERGAVPDIIVEQTPEAESINQDAQLRAAVDDLLNRL